MNYSISSSKWLVILAFAAIYVIWGSTYLAILFAIGDIPPFLMSALRFLAAGFILCIWGEREKAKNKPISIHSAKMLFAEFLCSRVARCLLRGPNNTYPAALQPLLSRPYLFGLSSLINNSGRFIFQTKL